MYTISNYAYPERKNLLLPFIYIFNCPAIQQVMLSAYQASLLGVNSEKKKTKQNKTDETVLQFLLSIWYCELKQKLLPASKPAPCDHTCLIKYSGKSIFTTGTNFIFIKRDTNRTLENF